MQLKRLQQEKDGLQRKVTRLTASIAAGGGGGGASSGADEQVDYYRRMVKCTLCQENEKNAIISKCGHTFCRDCIDERLANRNRKCPACSQQARRPWTRRHAHAMHTPCAGIHHAHGMHVCACHAYTMRMPCAGHAHAMHTLCTRYSPCTHRAHTPSRTAPCHAYIIHTPSLRSSTTRESKSYS